MKTGQGHYQAYLLRLWRVGGEGEAAWRASLEDAHTGERQGFADLDALFDHVRSQTRAGLDLCSGEEGEGREQIWEDIEGGVSRRNS
jgi:hypothetical protein